jgi:hypothetical protein
MHSARVHNVCAGTFASSNHTPCDVFIRVGEVDTGAYGDMGAGGMLDMCACRVITRA